MSLAIAEPGGSNGHEGGPPAARPPRLPRWTRQEILVLIEGKRAVESRGRGRLRAGAGETMALGGGATEPKWAAVSAYCRRRGVIRGAVQCRKRWSNLASDFKKIKEWELKGKETFWGMRNDHRRDRRLPGFFDREVFDILDGVTPTQVTEEVEVEAAVLAEAVVEEEEAVFDSGRTAAEDGLFSEEEDEEEAAAVPAVESVPISEDYGQSSRPDSTEQATARDKQPADNPDIGSPSQEAPKRRRVQRGAGDADFQIQLIEVLERNSKMFAEQLDIQNKNCQLDRDQRKDQANSLLGVLSKLADALGRIADKL